MTALCFAEHPFQNPPERLVSGASDGHIAVWDTEYGTQKGLLKGHSRAVAALDWRRYGGHPLLQSAGRDGTVRIWDLATETCLASAYQLCNVATSLRAFPTWEGCVQTSEDGKVHVWSTSSGGLRNTHKLSGGLIIKKHTFSGDHFGSCDTAQDGNQFATSASGGNRDGLFLWDIRQVSAPTASLYFGKGGDEPACVRFVPILGNGGAVTGEVLLASFRDGSLHCFSLPHLTELWATAPSESGLPLNFLAISRDEDDSYYGLLAREIYMKGKILPTLYCATEEGEIQAWSVGNSGFAEAPYLAKTVRCLSTRPVTANANGEVQPKAESFVWGPDVPKEQRRTSTAVHVTVGNLVGLQALADTEARLRLDTEAWDAKCSQALTAQA